MDIKAMSKSVQISPRKIRLVAQVVREKKAQDAVVTLSLLNKRAAGVLAKTIKSAVSNATNNAKLDPETLFVKTINVTEGKSLKRFHPSTRGRVHPYKKRASHIYVVLAGNEMAKEKERSIVKK